MKQAEMNAELKQELRELKQLALKFSNQKE